MAADKPALSLFGTAGVRPATFLERGVTAPFTTPMLLGARVRSTGRHGYEVLIRNPAKVRGTYVVSLNVLAEVCKLTLHDRQLAEAIASTHSLSPERMLRNARDVAQTGVAGRDAARAARDADTADRESCLITRYQLLLRLVEQVEKPLAARVPADGDTRANVERRARQAVVDTAARMHTDPDTVLTALEWVADAYAPVGLPELPTIARYQGQMADLELLIAEVDAWAASTLDGLDARSAMLVARSAELALNCARQLLRGLQGATADLSELIWQWMDSPGELGDSIARLAWLLDGWPTLVGLWCDSKDARAVREMAQAIPAIPIEADGWFVARKGRFDLMHRARGRFVARLQNWRDGRNVELMSRKDKPV